MLALTKIGHDSLSKNCLGCSRFTECKDPHKSVLFSCSRYSSNAMSINSGILRVSDFLNLEGPSSYQSLAMDDEAISDGPRIALPNDSDSGFNIAKTIKDIVENDKVVSSDIKINDRDFLQAPNFYTFCLSEKYLKQKPFIEQAILGTRIFAEFCPRCTDMEWFDHTHRVDDSLLKFEKKVALLEKGVCPHCKTTRSKLIKKYGLKFFNEAAVCCLAGDSLVHTSSSQIPIDQLSGKTFKVNSGHTLNECTDWMDQGVKPVYKTVTVDGYELTSTKDHRFQVLDANLDLVWKEAQHLTSNDYLTISTKESSAKKSPKLELQDPEINVTRKVVIPKKPKHLSVDLAYILGALVSDGHVSAGGSGNYFCSSSKEHCIDFISRFKRVFGAELPIELKLKCRAGETFTLKGVKGRRNLDHYYTPFYSKYLTTWLTGLGMAKTALFKEVPSIIFEATREEKLAFLAAFIQCDGSIRPAVINFFSSSRKMLLQIQTLLLSLGVVSSLSLSGQNVLSVRASFYHKLYADILPLLVIKVKTCETRRVQGMTYSGVPTSYVREFLSSRKTSDSSKRITKYVSDSGKEVQLPNFISWGSVTNSPKIIGTDAYARGLLTQDLELLRKISPSFEKKLVALLKGGYHFTKFSKRTYVGKQRTYDLTVARESKFVANGFVVHNCGQRSGKSAWIGMAASYLTHLQIKLQRPNEIYGLLNANILHGTFCALTYAQAKDTLWEPYYGHLTDSPWFCGYHSMLDSTGQRYGEELLKLKDTFVMYRHRRLLVYAAGPDKRTLRGRTRFFSSIDELGYFDNDAKTTKVKMNANEVYIALERSLLTVRASAEKLMARGFDAIPTAYFLNVSSPSSVRDKIMELVRKAQGSSKIYGIIKPTWEMNPHVPKSALAEEFRKDPVAAMRDYGAQPPLTASPFIASQAAVESCFSDKKNPIRITHRQIKAKDGTIKRFAVIDKLAPGRKPSILAMDAGYSNNSFAACVAHKVDNKIKFDLVVEVMPLPGIPLHYSKIFSEIIGPIIDDRNVVMMVADRWNSLKILSDAETEYDIATRQYSLKYADMQQFKSYMEDQQLIYPKPTQSVLEILKYDQSHYPACFKNAPMDHAVLQMLTVQDSGSQVVKGDQLTDDILRAMMLAVAQLLDPKNEEIFNVADAAPKTQISMLDGAFLRGGSSGGGGGANSMSSSMGVLRRRT